MSLRGLSYRFGLKAKVDERGCVETNPECGSEPRQMDDACMMRGGGGGGGNGRKGQRETGSESER